MLTKAAKAYKRVNLMIRIIIGLTIGVVLGLTIPGLTPIEMLGKLFVGALKAIAPILVMLLVMASIAKAGQGLGRRFRTVMGLYMSSTVIAAVIAYFVCGIFPVTLSLPGAEQMDSAPTGLGDVFLKLASDITTNPISAVSNAVYLSILLWAIIIGLALKQQKSEFAVNLIRVFADTVSQVVRWIIDCAPFGILGLVYSSVAESGMEIFTTYGQLLLVLVGCMALTSFFINPLIMACMLRTNPYPLVWRCLKESAVNAFFTRSSAANIPVNMGLCKRMGLDEDFYSVSIPLGSAINMDGAAVTITVMTLATCVTMGIEVPLGSGILLCIISALAACGASGVAGGSLLLIPMACSLFGISQDISMQVVAIGFIIGVVQDSVETALNSSGDAMFTATAELFERRMQGEKIDLSKLPE